VGLYYQSSSLTYFYSRFNQSMTWMVTRGLG
jgi:hypothetical protein